MSETDSAWFKNFAGASMNEWQAIFQCPCRQGISYNPNGRIGYSMLSYMNINMNNVINDVGRNLARVHKYVG